MTTPTTANSTLRFSGDFARGEQRAELSGHFVVTQLEPFGGIMPTKSQTTIVPGTTAHVVPLGKTFRWDGQAWTETHRPAVGGGIGAGALAVALGAGLVWWLQS